MDTRIKWYKTPKGKRAIRFLIAALAGLGFGILCGHLPEELRAPCRALAKVAAAAIGG